MSFTFTSYSFLSFCDNFSYDFIKRWVKYK
nr:MAG TPA: hypothetical protein [Caudoviricetes sp.]